MSVNNVVKLYSREEEGNQSAYDDCCVKDVPQVTTIRARMEQHPKVNDLSHTR